MRHVVAAENKESREAAAGPRAWGRDALGIVLGMAALLAVRALLLTFFYMNNGDILFYHRYALAFWTGTPPFHTLPAEYPPLSILPFTLTLLPPLANYPDVFTFWMGVAVVIGYIAYLRIATRGAAITYLVYLTLAAAVTTLGRFDIVPALVTLAALWVAERGRFRTAYVLLAVGALLKLYPLFLLPIILIAHWRRLAAEDTANIRGSGNAGWLARARRVVEHEATRQVAFGAVLCLGVTAVGFAAAYLISPGAALSSLKFARHRPLHVEATPASLLWVVTLVSGVRAHSDWLFNSCVYVSDTGRLDSILQNLSGVALVGGCLWTYWRQIRGKLTMAQAMLACLCVVIVTNKVFSPQYLIWVLPFVAAVEGFDLIWVAICVLTTVDFPILYHVYGLCMPVGGVKVVYSWQYLLDVGLRNGLLLFVTVRAIVRPGGWTRRLISWKPAPASSRGG